MEELILKERKFKEDLVNLINKSGLPAMLIKPIIADILNQVTILEQQQFEQALQTKNKKNKVKKESEAT